MVRRVAYGLGFVVALPALCVLWARTLDGVVSLPGARAPAAGASVAALGLGLMLAAWHALWRHAGGLPMNAFPPPRFIRRGVYRWLDDPIYIGAVLISLGLSLAWGSPGGLWVVTPVVAMSCAALVLGLERHGLDRRFGRDRPAARLRRPLATDRAPEAGQRVAVLLFLFLPWLLLYEAVGHLPVPGAGEAWLAAERGWPVLSWTEVVYASVYPVVIVVPFVARTSGSLRRFVQVGALGMLLGFLSYLVIPVVTPPRPFESSSWLGSLLMLERADGLAGRASFPSFHVFWACAAGAAWGARGRGWRPAAIVWLMLVLVSCSTTGMHAVADIAGGLLLYALALAAPALWGQARRSASRIANSWREWRIGPVRVINHGLYAGLGATVGFGIAAWLVGPGSAGPLAILGAGGLMGAGVWGQVLVGSRTLLRPFGYFGCVLGVSLAGVALALAGKDVWALGAALAGAAPWVQAIGRLRCLVQGCCHGARCEDDRGIIYRHPRSRVLFVAGLGGVPLHPTPLYSIAGNLLIGPLLLRLWMVQAPASFIIGAYLMLQGLARFVEESYRGEPQTQMLGPVRIYQLFAAVLVVAGALLTVTPSPAVGAALVLGATGWLGAGAMGVLYALAMGVDFPASNRRFSRLV